jgi:TolB protein
MTRIARWGAAALLAAAGGGAASGAAGLPVARARGLVVAHGGTIYVEGRAVARGDQPAWSPDGRRIAFHRNGEIRVVDRDGRHERRLTKRAPGLYWPASFPAWSRDGMRIAFGGTRDLYAVTVATGALTRLTQSEASWLGNFTPAYSPDGRTIAFSRSTDAFNNDIFVIGADGRHLRRVTTTQGTDGRLGEETMPSWSPDGRTLVFVSNRDGNWELYAIRRDGSGERRLTHTRADEQNPRWRGDGKRILFVREGQVASIAADGTGLRILGAGGAADWR